MEEPSGKTDNTEKLCDVCNEPGVSTFYGAYSCSACQKFFYSNCSRFSEGLKPCDNNQLCSVDGQNRSRCTECRLRKCLDVGMRVSGKVNHWELPVFELVFKSGNSEEVLRKVRQAHQETRHLTDPRCCDGKGEPAPSTSEVSCALSRSSSEEVFNPEAMKGVEEFARKMLAYGGVSDSFLGEFLQKGMFGVLLVRLVRTYDPELNTLTCWDGRVIAKDGEHFACKALWDAIFDFAERIHHLQLTDDETNLLCLAMIINMHHLSYRDAQISQIYNNLMDILSDLAKANRPESTTNFFAEFTMLFFRIAHLKGMHKAVRLNLGYLEKAVTQQSVSHDHTYSPQESLYKSPTKFICLSPRISPSPKRPEKSPGPSSSKATVVYVKRVEETHAKRTLTLDSPVKDAQKQDAIESPTTIPVPECNRPAPTTTSLGNEEDSNTSDESEEQVLLSPAKRQKGK